MTAKQMKYDSAAHEEFRDGVQSMAKAVGLTMGPAGRNVVVQKSYGAPSVTKDGVSVAKEIELPEAFNSRSYRRISPHTNCNAPGSWSFACSMSAFNSTWFFLSYDGWFSCRGRKDAN